MNNDLDNDMQPEYDFAGAERGKHYAGPGATFHVPIYLDLEIEAFLEERAANKGISLDRLVNDLLKGDIEAFRKLA